MHPTLALLPFAVLLLSIAALPLSAPKFWGSHRNKGLFTAAISLPVALELLLSKPLALAHTAGEYCSFLCLLGSLFVVSGGLSLEGDLKATPKCNVVLLAIGAILSNLIGTTGASMVLIRLVLRTNSERRNTRHTPFFFILLVANCGGLLTPLGDPPLFLGFLRGVPFFWTLRLLPLWLLSTGYLLAVYYFVDARAYARESRAALIDDAVRVEPIRVRGVLNLFLLLGIVASVFLPLPYRELTMLTLTVLSLRFGDRAARERNGFTFEPIVEVAILFAGIFVTMVPALALLRAHGSTLGLVEPWQYFLATGCLSSILDNAPTYLTFLSAAQGLGVTPDVVGVSTAHLIAISAGAVLMGANTYIGNGPNFMVKAIAEASGCQTYSFARYAVKATLILAPLYALVALYLGLFA